MRINKLVATFLLVSLGWLVSMNAYAQSRAVQSDPVALLQYIANNMIAGLKANKATLKTKPQIVFRLANRYVVPYADLPEMSRRVLPPQIWNSATPSQRMQFQKEFTTTLIRTYASALTSYQDQTVQFYPIRGGYQGLRTVEVRSEITGSETQPIQVTYRLMRVGSVWRLYDLSVEGVSMLESFRSQYAEILSSGSMEQLLQRMSQHNRGR
ncbi:MlaC/ttg2D family ABC transporter substrate-binding protein [Aquicella lusitana]|uniref:Phospholipid transport system substrate-binding protein n=1 Tax=Aquicella lusitana TaxID=254246 RepID=A0A370GYR0_9COXI|nr:ABC transporter substrate-binding protein [Aquicella lusitana]RDI48788.1 phospholipid transport system substrate-binding protein [Aquicella lusitana]VVC73216.1 putative phospholipid-binding protein MlaC [Aquicella lusitana]